MEYKEYDIVEKHIYFAKKLYSLNNRGKRFLQELDSKKRINKKKTYTPIIADTINILSTLTKPRVLCNNIYSSLLYYLDELLFLQVKETKCFIMDIDEYPLSYIYFNQHDWIEEEAQEFVLDVDNCLNDLEAVLLNCFVDEYEYIAIEIENFMQSMMQDIINEDRKMFKKILRLLSKLKQRILLLKSKILVIIYKSFQQ